ncbi:ATP-binding protein [Sphingobacterium sp. E70]|uniref:ATP-binding protein n=1 Tax=Sphingobacterium sp. E70 TaxID=2853439 RepID=UPI00359CA1FC|nr:ATP-binding protein [Sphingobacterium sp. E70]
MSALEIDGSVQIRIEDNGAGIPADLQEQIFTPFFTTKKTGTGVGLTLSKQIMLLHKGTIFLNSVEGKVVLLYFNFKYHPRYTSYYTEALLISRIGF